MKQEHMDDKQYTELTKSINKLASDVHKLHGRFGDIDAKVTSINSWIAGDPNIPTSRGTDEKIQRLEEKVDNNERELQRVKRIDELEDKVGDHQKRLDRIYTAIAVVSVIASVIGFFIGIFAPPFLG